MFPASFGYFAARSIEEALELLTRHGEDAKLLAGGHSLIPAMKLRLASPRYLIDLGRVPGLSGVRVDGDTLAIGALTVHADVASSELVRQRLPGLAEAASVIGDVQVRNRGTIGGSVAHADPAADFPVIPLETARAMSPRPPSPTTAAATQRAVRRENPNQLFTRSATTLTKMQSMSSFHGQKSKTSSPSRARTINSGGLTTKNVLPLSPKSPNAKAKAPVRPPRDARRKDPQPEVRR